LSGVFIDDVKLLSSLRRAVRSLRSTEVSFTDALAASDNFLFRINLVRRTREKHVLTANASTLKEVRAVFDAAKAGKDVPYHPEVRRIYVSELEQLVAQLEKEVKT
jgi:hypothetical protein